MSNAELRTAADTVLARLVGAPAGDARLREDQWRAIEALVADQRRALVVQRTGWGKSAVYFVATALLREQGAGPTVIVSPLLALMRNQIEAAERAGIRARTINSANPGGMGHDPGRGGRRRGRRPAGQPGAAQQSGLPRPCAAQARRGDRPPRGRRGTLHLRLGPRLPARLPAAAHDARGPPAGRPGPGHHRHGQRPRHRRRRRAAGHRRQHGRARAARPLDRESLRLGVLQLPDAAHRLAWLAERLDELPGSGIIYTLTVAAAEEVTAFLRQGGHAVASYTGQTDNADRRRPRRICSPTASRPSWPRPRWAWASTSPTSGSWSTWARRPRPSRTTSRSAVRGAGWSTPR